jgi:hypothetical protein
MLRGLLMRFSDIPVLIAPDLSMRETGVFWLMNYAKTKYTPSSILGRDHLRDVGNVDVEHHVSRPSIAIAAIWLKYVLRFAVLTSVRRNLRIH